MRDRAEKPAKVGDNLLVGSMKQKSVIKRSVIKKTKRQLQKTPKSPEFLETESGDSDNNGEEEVPVIKRVHKLTKKAPSSPRLTDTGSEHSDDHDDEKEPVVKKVSKSLGLVETSPDNSGDSGTENNLKDMGFPIDNSLEVGKNEEEQVLKKVV